MYWAVRTKGVLKMGTPFLTFFLWGYVGSDGSSTITDLQPTLWYYCLAMEGTISGSCAEPVASNPANQVTF